MSSGRAGARPSHVQRSRRSATLPYKDERPPHHNGRRTTTRAIPDAGARGFLARLHAGLLEIALVAQRLDDPLLVEDLLQALERAFNGLVLFQLELDSHLPFSPPWCFRPFGRRKVANSISKRPAPFNRKLYHIFGLSCTRECGILCALFLLGRVSEWSMVQPWKGCVGASLPGVRIPPLPPCRKVISRRRRKLSRRTWFSGEAQRWHAPVGSIRSLPRAQATRSRPPARAVLCRTPSRDS